MSEIIKNKLYLGEAFHALNENELSIRNIDCIICVAADLKIKNKKLKVYNYGFKDDYECDISLYFDEIGDIINNERIVLVKCVAGISRSATIVISYLMKYYKYDLKKAFLFVRSKRNQICPNKQFMNYLIDYEMQLFGKNSMTYEECRRLFYYS